MQGYNISWTVANFVTVCLMVSVMFVACGLLGIGVQSLIPSRSAKPAVPQQGM